MEACICSYLPKVPVNSIDPESSSLLSFEEETAEEHEIVSNVDCKHKTQTIYVHKSDDCKSSDENELIPAQKSCKTSPIKTDEKQNENNEVPLTSSESDVEISASKILVLETKNWIISRKLIQAEAEIDCLQQALHAQWTLRNQLNMNIQEFKNEKQKWTQETQKSFANHVKERNRLIQEIAEIRQRLLYITKSISLTESKNIELENEKRDTAQCLRKSITERRSAQKPISKNAGRNLLTTTTTDSDGSSSSYTDSSASRSTSSTDLSSKNANSNKQGFSSVSSRSGTTTTELESEDPKCNEGISSIPNDGKCKDASTVKKNVVSEHMRLDLSFLENPNHIDSGFSEANNMASKNSLGDYSTASRIEDINVFI